MATPNSPRNIAKIGRLAAWATRFFISAQVFLVLIIAYSATFDTLPRYDLNPSIPFGMKVMSTTALLIPFVYLAVLITNAVWLVRAARNAAELDTSAPSFAGGWTLGWFFIPIAHLWMPFRAIRYMWNVSVKGAEHAGDDAPPFFIIWWFCWIFPRIIDIAPLGYQFTMYDVLSLALTAVSAYQFLRIIRTVTDAQVHGDQHRLANVFA